MRTPMNVSPWAYWPSPDLKYPWILRSSSSDWKVCSSLTNFFAVRSLTSAAFIGATRAAGFAFVVGFFAIRSPRMVAKVGTAAMIFAITIRLARDTRVRWALEEVAHPGGATKG